MKKGLVLYIKKNNNVDKSIKQMLDIPSSFVISIVYISSPGIIGLLLLFCSLFSSDGDIYSGFGIFFVGIFLILFIIFLLNVIIHNRKVDSFIKKNINELKSEISKDFYFIDNFVTFLTHNYIICNYFNKKNIVRYSDITEIRREPSTSINFKSFNNQWPMHHKKNMMYGGVYNFVIKTKDKKRIYIPSPNIDSFIYQFIYSKNNSIMMDIDINQINNSNNNIEH